jgi:hypothetical protein
MAVHIFATTSYESRAIAIRADSEEEARGILQKKTRVGIDPRYRGTLSDVVDEDENFADLTNKDTYE